MARLPYVEHVDRAHFPETLATLRDVLQHASFVAFDTELSGLSAQLEKSSLMDSIAQRYGQMKESTQSFTIVQFGLSCFMWRADERVFDVWTFQFPIFPLFHEGHHNELPDRSFLVQAQCLTYIRNHGFDLNTWVDGGIGYLSHEEQKHLASLLQRPLREDVVAKFRGDTSTAIRTTENDRFLEDMRQRIQAIRDLKPKTDNKASSEQHVIGFLREQIKVVRPVLHHDGADVVRKVFVTEPQAPFRRSALIALVNKEFPDVVILDCPADNDSDPEVKASPWKRRLRLVAIHDTDEKAAFEDAHAKIIQEEHDQRNLSLVGFTAVFDVLTNTGRRIPLVGHNMLLDMMQCFDKFHAPLPDSCSRFLFELNKWLSNVTVFDTKVLIEHAMEHIDVFGERLEHSALEYVFECVSKDPFHGPPTRDAISCPSTATTETPLSAHQAGYDAYMTGIVFLRACSGLGVPNEAIADIGSLHSHPKYNTRWQETMLQLQNTLKLTQLLPPVELKIPGPFPNEIPMPSRERFLRVELTRAWLPKLKTHHIQHCIAWALNIRATKSIKVRYESRTSVFVQLPSKDQANELLKIRVECKETHGSERDPLPSLGCVELTQVEKSKPNSSNDEESNEPKRKRPKVEANDEGDKSY